MVVAGRPLAAREWRVCPWKGGDPRGSCEECCLQKEKVRVYALARGLKIDSKDLLDLCKQAGFDVKNQLSSLEPEQRDQLEVLIKKGAHHAPAAPAAAPKAVTPVVRPEGKAVPTLRTAKPPVRPSAPKHEEPPAHIQPVISEPTVVTPPSAPAAEAPVAKPAEPAPAKPAEPKPESRPGVTPLPAKTPALPPAAATRTPMPDLGGRTPVRPAADAGAPRPAPGGAGIGRTPTPGGRPGGGTPRTPGRRLPDLHHGLGPRAVPPPALKPLKPLEPKEKIVKPTLRLTEEQMKQAAAGKVIRPEDVRPTGVAPADVDETEDEADKKKKLKAIPGRDRRQQARNERAEQRKSKKEREEVKVRDGKLVLEDDRPLHQRIRDKKKVKHPVTSPRKGKTPIDLPITVRSLSEAIGVRSVQILFKLRDHNAPANLTINSTLEPDISQLVALDFGVELEVKKPLDAEELLLASYEVPDNDADLVPRAPIVTIMGHVDHGKTSLLDKIRQSNVVATEAGGITQVIRAWRVDHGGRPITFPDTPGHEAFTKMRARGAQVTDIAVIVAAADDGVMPQTEEAINHAKAAGVSLVVAINKVDLPSANINRTRQQLYSLEVLPDNMGGDTPFVETSAATGAGIDELLDQLSVVAELKELKANPHKPGQGTCLEAMLSEGEGVRATLLVRDGTLRRGDVILCGATYGRVRQMYDDQGRAIQEAGPSVPVRITGLDAVPNADDPFVVVTDLAGARAIADRRLERQLEAAQVKRVPVTLEKLTEAKIAELKIILKADFRGSIEAIKKELEKLHHEEVRVRLLEAAIGAITENDVWLALTSPQDTLIIGFNAVPDDRARALAEEKGVQIREYDIIYNLTNDIRAALEGKLKPIEEVVNLGRAVVRKTFKISRVGTVAGCFVTQGVIRRNAKVRLIRDGIVIYPPPDRSAGLDSLKRVKDDVAEVREGFECGLKIAGYDDVKVGDVIEAFRVEQVQRTL